VNILKPILMDVDTGIDDALAIMLAVKSKKVQLLGITTVSGNVHVNKAVKNTFTVLELLNAEVEVARGMEQPLVRDLVNAEDVHGEDGLGYLKPIESNRTIHPLHAVDFIIEKVKNATEKVTLVLLGPLTNIAVALKKSPTIKEKIKELIIMGGAGPAGGNIT
jgi:purine nucleosidase